MKYIKPELKFETIHPKQYIASGVEGWLAGEGMEDAGITPFYVTES